MHYRCPVCFFEQMPYPPQDFDICPCCGTEFGNDDVECTYEELRNDWIVRGALWFYGQPPRDWNPWAQLAKAAYGLQTEVAEALTSVNKTTIRGIHELEFQLV